MKKLLLPILLSLIFFTCSKTEIESSVDFLEYLVSGSTKSMTIIMDDESGKLDTLLNQAPPYSVKYKTFDPEESSIYVINNKIKGDIKITLLVNGKVDTSYTVTEPRAETLIIYNTKTGKTTAKNFIPDSWVCNFYNDIFYFSGPQGGCYYYSSSGIKTNVDMSNCSCD